MVGRFSFLLVFLLCTTCSEAEKPVKFPLSDIWAIDMPGTRDFRNLLKDQEGGYIDRSTQRLFDTARRTLLEKYPERAAAKGFAVSGTGRDSLAEASRILHEGRWGVEPLESNGEISLVFFSYASSYRVCIEKIDRHHNTFQIAYRFVPQYTVKPTIQLALIPIGKLPVGEYKVEIDPLPLERKYRNKGFKPVSEEDAKRIVCQSYTFQVYERPAPDLGPAKDATVIPLDQIWALDMPGTKDIRELEPGSVALSTGPLEVLQILEKKRAGPGFVVAGTGREALLAAQKKLPPGEIPPNELPYGTEATVVYYSHAFMPYIVLHRVERQGNTINIRYRHDATGNTSYSSHFALIPLGKLPMGKYKVNMIPVWDNLVEDSPFAYLELADDVQRVVCQSFEFTITPAGNE